MFHILTSVNPILVCFCCKEHTSKTSSPEMIKTEIKSTYMKCDNKDSITMSHTMHPAVYYDATSASQLLAGAA
jgi:hypothetical protein